MLPVVVRSRLHGSEIEFGMLLGLLVGQWVDGPGLRRCMIRGLLLLALASALARALKSKESETGPAFDEIRPTMTEDGTISADEQRKALEYLLSPAQQKEPCALLIKRQV